nr:MAG TPA: hypothetical protein [Caudoviricetes sp.]
MINILVGCLILIHNRVLGIASMAIPVFYSFL